MNKKTIKKKVTTQGKRTITELFDTKGRIILNTDGVMDLKYSYSDNENITKQFIEGKLWYTATETYNDQGKMIKRDCIVFGKDGEHESRNVRELEYDDKGHLTKDFSDGKLISDRMYDDRGNRIKEIIYSCLETESDIYTEIITEYDELNRKTRMYNNIKSYDITYVYDDKGNNTSYYDKISGLTTTMVYDDENREVYSTNNLSWFRETTYLEDRVMVICTSIGEDDDEDCDEVTKNVYYKDLEGNNLLSVCENGLMVTSYKYNENGDLTSVYQLDRNTELMSTTYEYYEDEIMVGDIVRFKNDESIKLVVTNIEEEDGNTIYIVTNDSETHFKLTIDRIIKNQPNLKKNLSSK